MRCCAREEVHSAHSWDQTWRTCPLDFGKFLPQAETDTARPREVLPSYRFPEISPPNTVGVMLEVPLIMQSRFLKQRRHEQTLQRHQE